MDTVSDSGSGRSNDFGMLHLARSQLLPQSANSQDLKSYVQINRRAIIITILTQIICRTGFHIQLSRLNSPADRVSFLYPPCASRYLGYFAFRTPRFSAWLPRFSLRSRPHLPSIDVPTRQFRLRYLGSVCNVAIMPGPSTTSTASLNSV